MYLTRLTSIQRPIDPRYPTNLAIAALTFLVGGAGFACQLLSGGELFSALVYAFNTSVTVFLSWALARELDPDHDYSAFLAAALGIIGFLVFGAPSLLVLLFVLVALRTINRCVGPKATLFDSLTLMGLGGYLTFQYSFIYGILAVIVFLLDGMLPAPNRRQLVFAAVTVLLLVGFIVAKGIGEANLFFKIDPNQLVIMLAASAGSVPLFLSYRRVKAVDDLYGQTLNPQRVQAGLGLGLAAAWLVTLSGGFDLIQSLWMVIAGVAIFYLVLSTLGRIEVSKV